MKREIVLLIVIFAIGIFLRIIFMNVTDYRTNADEGFYLRYSKYLAQEKDASIKFLSKKYIEDKDWQMFPNPLRAGYIILAGWWMKILKMFDFRALTYMSAVFSVLSLFVGYLFAKSITDGKIAMLSLILFASSPINIALSRRALQDGVVYFFMISAIYLFYLALKRDNIFLNMLFAAVFYTAVMVKESSIVLMAFFLFFIFWDKVFFRKGLKVVPMVLSLAVVVVATLLSYMYITGGFDNLAKMAKIILASPLTNQYAIKYQSGPLSTYLYDFFLVSPLTMIAAVGFLILYFINTKLQNESNVFLVISFFVIYMGYSFFSKNLRYVMVLDLPIRIFAAMFIANIVAKAGKKAFISAFAVVALIGLIDIAIFKNLFINHAVYDPVTYSLIMGWKG